MSDDARERAAEATQAQPGHRRLRPAHPGARPSDINKTITTTTTATIDTTPPA